MSTNANCDEVRELAAELALDVAVAEERGRALSHLDGCGECRRLVRALSDVADELLRLAPAQEPPPGFESRIVERIAADGGRARDKPGFLRRRSRLALATVTAVAAAVAAGFGVYAATEEDRELGKLYRQSLAVANGKAFVALPLQGPDRRRAGTVFGYEGRPSWLFVIVRRPGAAGRFAVEVDTRRGARVPLGSLEVKDGRGSFGAILPVQLFDVGRVRIIGPGTVLTAVAPPLPK